MSDSDPKVSTLNTEVIKLEKEKLQTLSLLSEEQRNILAAAIPFTTIPYMPITKEFIQGIILNETEYPLLESKASQAATEMKSRMNALVDNNYEYKKLQLEIQSLEIEIEELKENEGMSERRRKVEIEKKELEMQIKSFRAQSIASSCKSVFEEFKNWSETVQDCVSAIQKIHPEVKSLDDVRFDKIRIIEMQLKIQKWRAMQKAGLELTAPQQVFAPPVEFKFDRPLTVLSFAPGSKKEEQPKVEAVSPNAPIATLHYNIQQ